MRYSTWRPIFKNGGPEVRFCRLPFMRDWRKNDLDMPMYGAACFSVSNWWLGRLPNEVNGVLSCTFVPLVARWSMSGIFGHQCPSEQMERLVGFAWFELRQHGKRLNQKENLGVRDYFVNVGRTPPYWRKMTGNRRSIFRVCSESITC